MTPGISLISRSSGSVASEATLFGGNAGVGKEHVDHRHRDLRVFLARREDQPHDAQPEAGEQQQRRERRVDEGLGQTAGQPEVVTVAVTVARGFAVLRGDIVGHVSSRSSLSRLVP
ncbi:MAG: hypothetical protein R3D59_11810 [Paracoccaceae bacterium]